MPEFIFTMPRTFPPAQAIADKESGHEHPGQEPKYAIGGLKSAFRPEFTSNYRFYVSSTTAIQASSGACGKPSSRNSSVQCSCTQAQFPFDLFWWIFFSAGHYFLCGSFILCESCNHGSSQDVIQPKQRCKQARVQVQRLDSVGFSDFL